MKKMAWLLMVVMALGVAGCAKKSASEQLKDDMNKAANQIKKDLNSL